MKAKIRTKQSARLPHLVGALLSLPIFIIASASATDPPPPPPPGEIGDTVFCDENENGVQDGNEPGIAGVTVNLLCSSSIWPDDATPAVLKDPDTAAVELGVKFQSEVDGLVTGVRFYKGPSNTGPHVGNLWDSDGNLLATVNFTNETASGWQQADFGAPVAISANTTYVVSYHAPNGCYSVSPYYFSDGGLNNPPLRSLRNGEDGNNGVYAYGPGGFPTDSFGASNYWVDVVFEPAAVRSEVTDANGKYLFTGVPAGATCTVWIDPTTAPPSCNRVIPECPTVMDGIGIGPGESYLDADFCLAPPLKGQIGDTVFCDLDEDGVQDAAEPGLEGVKVTLVCDTAGGTITLVAFTNANGNYLFTDLDPGTCHVSVDPNTAPADCNRIIPECPVEMNVDLGPGESFLDADFCFAPPPLGRIGDTVFCDLNANGVQESGDFGLSGVRVDLYCELTNGDTVTDFRITDVNGAYLFDDLLPGQCTVTVDESTLPDFCNRRVPNCEPSLTDDLGPAETNLDFDFCFQPPPPASIGDTVWCDENEDGFQQPGESGIPGVTVNLECLLSDGSTVTDSQQTAADGTYLFTGLLPGTCAVSIDPSTAPPDCNRVIPQCPTSMTGIVLGPGDEFLDADFCLAPPLKGEIGDTVFCDENRNGIQDSGEPGIPNVKVTLVCDTPGGTVTLDTLTDPDGMYLFTDLGPGTCTVSVDPNTAPPDCNVVIPECPTEMTVVLDPGESFLDADFCFAPCALQVEAFCAIPQAPGDGDDCDGGKPNSVTIVYTAQDCTASSNTQDPGKAVCTDYGSLPSDVYVVVSDRSKSSEALQGDGKTWFAGSVSTGTPFTATSANGGDSRFASNTYIHLFASSSGPILQKAQFHTSCSQPLAVGNQFGASLITGLSFDDGRVVTLPDPGPGEKDCEIVLSPGVICPDGDDIFSIDFLYTAEDCTATSNSQDSSKVSCQDFGALPSTAWVVVSDEDKASDALDGQGKTYFEGPVDINTVFTAAAANAGEDKFSSETYIHAFADANGGLLQSIKFHTSCSQPLNTTDQFGGFAVFGATTKDSGTVSEGTTVTFTYKVSNTGVGPLTGVTVTDSYGEVDGSPISSIAAGETVTLSRVVLLNEDTSNQVTASSDGGTCEDSDTTTVTLIPPPPGPIECTSKIKAMLLTYIGPNLTGTVTVVFDPSSGPNVVYELLGGLSTGETLSSQSQNGFTIDASAANEDDLGSKVIISINGVQPDSGIHTSCSAPFIAQQPAPLNDPKGDPSPNWFVEQFTQK